MNRWRILFYSVFFFSTSFRQAAALGISSFSEFHKFYYLYHEPNCYANDENYIDNKIVFNYVVFLQLWPLNL